jgi:hypothetical protein
MPDLSEHVVEIRYKPNPKILDYRGSWAEAISDHMKLPKWVIVENRIDIYDESNGDHAFVGFRNAGFTARNTPTKNYFSDKAVKLFKYLFTLNGFEKKPYVERIGVRSKFCRKYEGTFEELREKYSSNYLSLTEKAKKIMDAKLLDIGGPLNFADKYGNFNTMSGPMIKEQMLRYFQKTEDLPAVGLYFDIDYWLMPKKEMDGQEILNCICQFSESAWDRSDAISKLILGE